MTRTLSQKLTGLLDVIGHAAELAAVRERPILFSGPMVRALLEDRKTKTRRIVKPQPAQSEHGTWGWTEPSGGYRFGTHTTEEVAEALDGCCPYGNAGDRLWVRETWAPVPAAEEAQHGRGVLYRCDPMFDGMAKEDFGWDWKPSIHMPRWASRLTLEITAVRVERIQDITAGDCIAEGIPSREMDRDGPNIASAIMYIHDYETLWNELNAARGYGWDANPWVWVIAFRRLLSERGEPSA